jgi:energy-coupling factor transporter ATP-binding protein EcfA2
VLDTDHSVIVMAGPNGSGKTGILRLVATSLENRRYFDEHGVSRVWEDPELKQLVKDAAAAPAHSPGWRKVFGSHWMRVFGAQFEHLNLGLSWDADVHPDRDKALSDRAVQAIAGLEARLREPSDGNRYGYVKPETNEPVYIQELAAPVPPDHPSMNGGWHQGYKPFTYFDPGYDGKNSWLAREGKIQSPGEASHGAIKTSFDRMRQFMEEGLHYPFKLRSSEMGGFIAYSMPQQPVQVPRNARLVVFMDEQTAFLDPRNAEFFRKGLIDAVERYRPRLQVWLTTNDRYFLEHAPRDSAVVNLYEQPATITTPTEVLRIGTEER